jgi:hypothetical protein
MSNCVKKEARYILYICLETTHDGISDAHAMSRQLTKTQEKIQSSGILRSAMLHSPTVSQQKALHLIQNGGRYHLRALPEPGGAHSLWQRPSKADTSIAAEGAEWLSCGTIDTNVLMTAVRFRQRRHFDAANWAFHRLGRILVRLPHVGDDVLLRGATALANGTYWGGTLWATLQVTCKHRGAEVRGTVGAY